jgi:hypothetical protein
MMKQCLMKQENMLLPTTRQVFLIIFYDGLGYGV